MKQQALCSCGRPAGGGRGMCISCYGTYRDRQIAYGRWKPDRVPAAAARAHLAKLHAAGVKTTQLPTLTGISKGTVLRTMKPETAQISEQTAAAILAVPIPERAADVVADNARVPALGARRRIQALISYGYTQKQLAEQIGIDPSSPTMAAMVERPHAPDHTGESITAEYDRRIKELFDRLQVEPGPSDWARAYGAQRGWPLPLEWDEEEIDNPAARPVQARRTEQSDRAAIREERRERVLELVGRRSETQIAEEVGLTQRTVQRIKARYLSHPAEDEEEVPTDDERDEEDEVMELTEDE